MKLRTTLLPGHYAVVACGVGEDFLPTNNESFVHSQNHLDESELHQTSIDCE
jgi:hypothetical protein